MNANRNLRIGIVGLGNIGLQHIAHINGPDVEGLGISAVCSRNVHPIADETGAKHFTDFKSMIDSGDCDAVLVATPTFTHFDIGLYTLERGLHLLMEKPIGLSAHEGEQLLAARGDDQVFAVMLNQRTDPVYRRMHEEVTSGALGEIQRTHWTMTNWFRPEVYFQASDWRATWRGEGGGLLVNQCIHNLDIYQWVCGMPATVSAQCGFGRYHDIEVEDEATAMLSYETGASGVFIGSTGESPGVNRFDVVGDRGTLSYDGERLLLCSNDPATAEYNKKTREMFGAPDVTVSDITPAERVNQHALILQNFVDAVRSGAELIAPAADALDSLNLANAILLSAWRKAPVKLPFAAADYHAELSERIATSSLREKADVEVVIDMDKSYR